MKLSIGSIPFPQEFFGFDGQPDVGVSCKGVSATPSPGSEHPENFSQKINKY